MSQTSYTLPVGLRVIKITHRDVSCHGEQSDHICKKYSDQMNFNEVYTRGGYRRQTRPLICQKTARYINFFRYFSLSLPLDKKKRETDPNARVYSVFRLLCCSELGNLNKLFQIRKRRKKSLSGVHFVRNYIFAGKVNFEGILND